MWLRVNSRLASTDDYLGTFSRRDRRARGTAGAQAVVLDSPCDVGELPGFAEGRVSVQDLGAQCVAFPLALLTASEFSMPAPRGGKTALMLERADLKVVAVDVDPKRLARVGENLRRENLAAELVNGDATVPERWWNGVPFDRILLDAPCSALASFAASDIRLRKSPSDIDKLPQLQSRLLHSAWRMLAPGGRLVMPRAR